MNTESRLEKMKYSNGQCKLCNTGETENIDHLMMGCRHNKIIWELLERIIQMVFGRFYKIDLVATIFGFWSVNDTQSPSDIEIINVLMGICRYHIWKIRNCIKYENEKISITQSVSRLKIELNLHLQTLLFSHSTCQIIKEKLEIVQIYMKDVL